MGSRAPLLVALALLPLLGFLDLTQALALAVLLLGVAFALVLRRGVWLAHQNQTLGLVINASENAKVILDASRAITYENDAFRRAFPGDRPRKQNFSRFIHDTFAPECLASLVAAVETASAWRGRVTSKGEGAGEPQWFELVLSPVAAVAEQRSQTAILVTLRNVTELARYERLRRLDEEGEKTKTEIVMAMAHDAPLAERCSASLASLCQLEGLETYCQGAAFVLSPSRDAVELLGYCGDFSERFVTTPPVAEGTKCAQAMREGRLLTLDSCEGEDRVHHCDMSAPHGHYVVPLLEQPGQPLGVLLLYTSKKPSRDTPRLEALLAIAEVFANAVMRDRTARLLIESSRRAEAATRAKSDFLATMSHEIRTPMNGVLGFTQLLLESQLSDEQREHAQLIFNSAEALLALLNDILDFSRIEAGKLAIDPRPAAIVETCKETVDLLRAAAHRKGIELTFCAATDVPRGLMIDAMRFRQVLLNLTGNAVKFTPSGSVDVSLRVVVDGGARWLEGQVKDTGIGISASVLPHLFGQFVQADTSTSRRFGGSGLGLAISKRLVELMGGTIGATSVEGEGSTFWLRLPIVEVVLEGRRRAESNSKPVAHHRRVLLAEDNPINQMLARKVLEKMSAEVVVATNGKKAVELALAGGFDLVLMDCQMPEMDGYDATRAIRAWERVGRRSRLSIVAVTANAFAEDVQRCLDAGMDAVLTKPFKLHELERALGSLDRSVPRATG